jgi:hypothetical protein
MKSYLQAAPRTTSPSSPSPSNDASVFKDVVESEWDEIRLRRRVWNVKDGPRPTLSDLPDDAPEPPPSNLVGSSA